MKIVASRSSIAVSHFACGLARARAPQQHSAGAGHAADERASRVLRAIRRTDLSRDARVPCGIARRVRGLIALTFDDGPYPIYTPMLLDVLARSAAFRRRSF